MEAHGGEIHLESEEGRGSTFSVLLPYLRQMPVDKQVAQQSKRMPLARVVDKYILVVDDNEENRELLCEFFNKSGQKYITASSGEESVKLMNKFNKDIVLILMDIEMNGMSGVEAMKEIRARHDVLVVAVTAHAMEGYLDGLLTEGFDDYISKPIDIDTLHNRIDKFLRRDSP